MKSILWRCLAVAICSIVALPAAEFTTYIGNATDHYVGGVVADAAGNTFIAGGRVYAEGAFPYSDKRFEAFIKKLDSTGKTVLFTILNGGGSDAASALSVDAAGNIYITGATSSSNLPLRNPLQATPCPRTPLQRGLYIFLESAAPHPASSHARPRLPGEVQPGRQPIDLLDLFSSPYLCVGR